MSPGILRQTVPVWRRKNNADETGTVRPGF